MGQDLRWKPNVTAAAIIERDGRFLLVEEETRDGLKLNNPAGHLDPGESPAQTCTREVMEETAHRFEPTALVGIYLSRAERADGAEGVTYLRFAFCGRLGEPLPGRPLDTGIVRLLWMTAEEVRASHDRHRSPSVLRCIEDYLAGIRYPMAVVTMHDSARRPT